MNHSGNPKCDYPNGLKIDIFYQGGKILEIHPVYLKRSQAKKARRKETFARAHDRRVQAPLDMDGFIKQNGYPDQVGV